MKENREKYRVLAVLVLVLSFNNVDGLALGLMLQDIKRDLAMTDTQLGLLTGLAFAFFYSFMGLPLARWADRGNRVTIISLTTAIWGIAVFLCGFARSFLQLLTIRIGAAVGEAGCIPTGNSLLADYFGRAERPKAAAIYMLGGPISIFVGYFGAGWMNEYYGWRTTFMLLGLPGLLLSVISLMTLKEPRLALAPALTPTAAPTDSQDPGLEEVCRTLWSNHTFRQLLITYPVMAFFGYGILQWQPAFFVRSYGLSTGELGTWLAVLNGVFGLIGTYGGGWLATRYAANNERLQLRAMAILYVLTGIVTTFVYLASNMYVSFVMIALSLIIGAVTNGPLFAVIQTLVPQRMRAISIALVMLLANLVGMGLGPLAAGALSDAFTPLFGQESLRYALAALCPGYLWGAFHVWRASSTVGRDLQSLADSNDEAGVRQGNGHDSGRCSCAG